MLRAGSAIVLLLALVACGRDQVVVRPDPPAVTQCLEQPSAHVPDEPERPAPGGPIPDAYVVALLAWANSLLGVVTQDRITWAGERACIQQLRARGQVL